MTDEQFIEMKYYLDRIATAVETLASAANSEYRGKEDAGARRAAAKRELNAKRLQSRPPEEPGSGDR